MKKLLSVVVALVCVLSLTCTAFAAGSTTEVVSFVATDEAGNPVEVTAKDVTDADKQAGYPWLTVEEAAQIIGEGTAPAELAIPWQKDLTAATTPVTLAFEAAGVAAPQSVYLFHYVDGAWKIEASAEGAKVSAKLDSMSPFAFVIKTPASAAKDNAGKSANTGETNAIPFAMAAVIAAGALVVALNSKKRNA